MPCHPRRSRRSPAPSTVRLPRTLAAAGGLLGPAVLAAAAGVGTPAALPAEPGDLLTTSFSGFDGTFTFPDPDGPVLTLTDVRVPPLFGNPTPVPGAVWTPPMFNNIPAPPIDEWRASNLGQVFGLTPGMEPEPDIYVAATSAYGDFSAYPWPAGGLGPDGPGAIYRIDGVTGEVFSWVVTGTGGPGTNEMPNDGPAIGQVTYDTDRDQFFATNLDDGGIYRIDPSGIILDVYDPWIASPDDIFHARLGDRPWAVAVRGDRLYFSNWLRDSARQAEPWPAWLGPVPPMPNNSIWSLQIDGSGALVGVPQLEIVVPWLNPAGNGRFSNPVSDISFSDAGRMLLAERTMAGDYGLIDIGHQARLLEYDDSSGSWFPTPIDRYIGTLVPPSVGYPANAAGGADYGCQIDDPDLGPDVWAGGDIIGAASYGVQRVPPGGNTLGTPVSTSWLIPWPVSLKSGVGDVDYIRGDCDVIVDPCLVVCPSDASPEGEPCGGDTNHGCDGPGAPTFTGTQCGATSCGNFFADGGARDTDWYALDVPDPDGDGLARITVRLNTAFPAVVRIESFDCTAPVVYAMGESNPCEPVTITACVPAPGVIAISVKPETISGGPIFSGLPCGDPRGQYIMTPLCSQDCDCVEPPSEMIAWYPLDETSGPVADELIQDADLEHIGDPIEMPGLVAGALCFTTGRYAELPSPATELNVGTSDFSIDAWVRPADATGTEVMIDKRTQSGSTVFGYSLFLLNGELGIQISDGSFFNWLSGATLPVGEWSFVAVTVDRDDPNGLRFFVDGNLVAVFDPTIRPGNLDNDGPFRLGVRSISLSGTYDGCLDEVEIFTRALSPNEISELYFAGPLGKCKPDPCPGDIDGSGGVDFTDIIELLSTWGVCPAPCPTDLNGDGFVTFDDLVLLLSNWGPCD